MLGKIWKLSDHDKDGYLDDEEFALGWFLTDNKVAFQDVLSVTFYNKVFNISKRYKIAYRNLPIGSVFLEIE